MTVRIVFLGIVITLSLLAAVAAPEELLYLCPGEAPLYTNRVEFGCPVYEPTGRVVIAPAGATWAEIKLLATGPSVATGGRGDAGTGRQDGTTPLAVVEADPDLCALYREWAAMNLKSTGGFYHLTPDERNRWIGLQKVFTLAGVPQCP